MEQSVVCVLHLCESERAASCVRYILVQRHCLHVNCLRYWRNVGRRVCGMSDRPDKACSVATYEWLLACMCGYVCGGALLVLELR